MATGEFLEKQELQDIEVQKTETLDTSKGLVGTKIANRLYDEDYLSSFKDLQKRALIYERMSKSDPIIKAILRIQKTPILQAEWSISFDDEEIDDAAQSQLDYINQVIFKDLNFLGCKLFEILTMLEYGYAVFEKVFIARHTEALGDYISMDLPIRFTKTIHRFLFKDPDRPDMITHFVQVPDFASNRKEQRGQIDLETKTLLVFTLEKIGNDPTGTAVLRACYKPFTQKDLIERMQMVGVEKSVLGTPLIKIKDECGNAPCDQKQLDKVTKQVASYLGNTNQVITMPASLELELMMGKMNNAAVENAIQQKNTEIVMSILAQFILLGQDGNGGAFALGQDQSDFFLNSLQYTANVVTSVMNPMIQTLIDLQFGPQEVYPTMKADGINSKANSEFATTIKDLSERGLIVNSEDLIRHIHKTYKLPLPDDFQMEESPPDSEDDNDENTDTQNLSIEGVKKKSAEVQLQASFRGIERTYTAGVTRNEKFIQDFYSRRHLPIIERSEAVVRKILNTGYAKTSKEIVGGSTYIADNRRNSRIKNQMKRDIKSEFKKLSKKLLSPQISGKLLDGALKNADLTIKETLTTTLAFMRASEFRSFAAGHISNMKGVFFNEERQILETVEANFGNKLKLSVIQSQVDVLRFNRNTLKLSVTSHPRAVFKGESLRAAQSVDINDFKLVIPSGTKLKPSGETIKHVYVVQGLAAWEALLINSKTGSGVVGGLGIHHNSLDYYVPVSQDNIQEATKFSREQRKSENLAKITEPLQS